MAERWSWRNFCLYGIWFVLLFSIHANWVWGGGWLAQAGVNWKLGHGVLDFAGSGAIHALGGVVALAGAWAIGPRLGKYQRGRPQPVPGHHVSMVVAGTLVLAIGWFGLNVGCFVGGGFWSDGIVRVVANTAMASAAGAAAAMLTLFAKRMKPDPTFMCNGLLAGLVAISASCPLVSNRAAVLIGAVAGVLVVFSVMFLEKRGIDDPVGAISIHGLGGIWGLLAVGLLAGDGSLSANCVYGPIQGFLSGGWRQLLAQLLDIGVILLFGLVAYGFFRLSDLITPLRVSRDHELEGLDGPEMGALAYPDFTVTKPVLSGPSSRRDD